LDERCSILVARGHHLGSPYTPCRITNLKIILAVPRSVVVHGDRDAEHSPKHERGQVLVRVLG